ncbi:MAG: tRNA pseudouridine(38-40) synthase TruA [Clostridia bacterium]|nr:tRNA pseudouridine(38-40) synthase TruA [Clostridia bacterium]
MKRYLLDVSYDGTAYCGWQRQSNGPSVQQTLEETLSVLLGTEIKVTGASRTDAGVHALGQRAHFDAETGIPAEKLPFALNTMLPPDIRALRGQLVPDSFHARFSVSGKTYTYRIHNAPHASAIYRATTAHIPVTLDDRLMDEAARQLLGTHDFAAFAAAGGSAKTTVRSITDISVERKEDEVSLSVSGNAFLYNMVRIIAGTLIDIGHRKLPPDCLSEALRTGDRLSLGPTAPAQGLELTHVYYPDIE